MYNALNKPFTEEELLKNPNPSYLTVGARAVQKHATRPGQNSSFWAEKNSLNGLTEQQKNLKAEEAIGRVIDETSWINIHTLHPSSMVYILEIRNSNGFGARWEIGH
mmetsp:Transcript_13247/g.20697  ORF Transcript_13247/g.20697 Transcript_13247/m.20697 type:complete len:107 (-) Transcript_13247:98-418(-)